MDRFEALKLLDGRDGGIPEWNRRRASGQVPPDLSRVFLRGADLRSADLSRTKLCWANLIQADLRGANLSETDCSRANLSKAKLSAAILRGTDLSGAVLTVADLSGADLSRAILREADLRGTDLSKCSLTRANLSRSDLGGAYLETTIFGAVDLSAVKGLDTVIHRAPSVIGIEALVMSRGKVPIAFLQGCGVPDFLIPNLSALISAIEPIQFYSCFISYRRKDEEFAKHLHSRMRETGLRVWFAPEDIQGGKKLYEQIDEAIRVYDKLLLVLSPNSINSDWVKTEIRKAQEVESRDNRRKLFPIRLVDYNLIQNWQCFDADSGKDLAVEIRQYFIPDFSNWKEQNSFETAWKRLLNDLKAEESIRPNSV